jgi:signal transduction histidine kinase/ActR/RegA family two-component response regulator
MKPKHTGLGTRSTTASREEAATIKEAGLHSRELLVKRRESGVFFRERAVSDKALALDAREALARAHEERDRLVAQMREANEQLVLTALRAEQLLEEAAHARAIADTARAKLEQTELALREASHRKDEFLAMLGHELRNPLAPIQTALDLMNMRAEPGSRREREVIGRQVRYMTDLIDDLLDVSRITTGKLVLRRAPLEISTVVAKAIELASPLFESRHHRFSASVAEAGLVVDGDATRLSQVIANLLTNAAKYTDAGGTIVVSARREGPWVQVSVEDNGTGLSAELLPAVFDRFVQARQTLDRAPGGLGLGLAIVRSLVELHGGEVSAHSAGLGLGSEFVVRLPALDDVVIEPVPPVPRSAPSGTIRLDVPCRVLVVDDNADAAEMLAAALIAGGDDVVIADDGPEALRVVASFTPDVVVLDIGLPLMDGYELARLLREHEQESAAAGAKRIRLIAVTGYGQEADHQQSAAAGIDVHLVKPVDLAQLRAAIAGRPGDWTPLDPEPPPH